ncbi:hypothetical protein HC891_01355 [Candidatus Gracilibacteria bacterium]|nr:hypothetical protein [Candidatus Gracilibacteria bacterium]
MKQQTYYDEQYNEFGCPIYSQSGAVAIKHFAHVLARFSPEERAAFERERRARQDELDQYTQQYGYRR